MKQTPTQQLRERLRETNLSTYRLGIIAGVGDAVVRRFMAGRDVSSSSFDRLAGAFGCELLTATSDGETAPADQGGLGLQGHRIKPL